eukprot:m.22178 g.22178  ORF g.22178 m.22178 type:complete len:358 (-) comp5429_c0_seq1:2205-3278(-)
MSLRLSGNRVFVNKQVMGSLVEMLRKHWFLFGIVAFILLARLAPWIGMKGGPLQPEYTIKYGAVFLIFFNSGLTLKSEELKNAVMQYKLHFVIQVFTLALVPLTMAGILPFVRSITTWNEHILTGLSVLSCLPPPVSSAVILTVASGGNGAAAIFNSAFGSFLGIFVTPFLLFSVVGQTGGVPMQKIFISLSLTVVLPIVLGQFVRFKAWDTIKKWNIPFSSISSFVLLLIIYAAFCETFSEPVDVDAWTLIGLVVFIVVILLVEKVFLFYVCQYFKFAPKDTACVLFCATHKSLTLGIPILNIVFGGYKNLSLISVPILIYHPAQILLGGVLVPTVKAWVTKASNTIHNNDISFDS